MGDRYRPPDGPPVETVHRACGHVYEMVPTCAACGEPVRPGELEARPGPGAGEEQRRGLEALARRREEERAAR